WWCWTRRIHRDRVGCASPRFRHTIHYMLCHLVRRQSALQDKHMTHNMPLVLGASMLIFTTALAVPPSELKKDLDEGNQAWVVGLKTGDAYLVAAAYADDSVHCSAAGDCVRGREAAAAQYKDVITKFGRATDAFVRSESLRVDHDLAYESGYAEAHFAN